MRELRAAVRSKLLECHERVYFLKAPSDAIFPYVVFNFPTAFMQEETTVYTMDVDVWDSSTDTAGLESIADTVWSRLDQFRQNDVHQNFVIYRQARLVLEDEDPSFNRRKMIFFLRYVKKEGVN